MYIERQYDTYAKKKNENKYSKSLNMQYKKKIYMQVMHFEEMCRFYYFILKEKKNVCIIVCTVCFFLSRDVGLTMLTKLFWIYFSSIKDLVVIYFIAN